MTDDRHGHHPRPGFTLLEVIIALALVAGLVTLGLQQYTSIQQQSADKTAIATADQLAQNFAHYASLHNGVYPWVNGGTWTWGGAIGQMGGSGGGNITGYAEFQTVCPAIFSTNNCYNIWTGDGLSNGAAFYIVFTAAGGTGTWYCRDAVGVATTPYNANQPWYRCP